MSCQYPPSPRSGANFKPGPKPGSNGNFQTPPEGLSQQVLDSNLFLPGLNQRASNEEGKLANIRYQASAEKRNKLGYHRSPIACGHCRKRRIRCILEPANLQNRCQTCIRLKRECTFHRVVRAPQPESKGQRGTSSGRGLDRASSSAFHTDQLECPLETQNGLLFPNIAMPPDVGSSDIKRLTPENIGLPLGAQEYQPDMAPFIQSKPPPSTRPVLDASSYWGINTQEDLAPAYTQTLNPFQQQNWSLGAVNLLFFEPLENLPQQAPYQEVFTNRTSPPGAKPYVYGISPGDPNSIALSGSTIGSSHIPDPRQQPSSSAPQPWQSVPQCGYYNDTAQAGQQQ